MLGGADNSNGELPSFITGADQIVRQYLTVDVDAKRRQRRAVTFNNDQFFTEPVFGIFQHSGDRRHGETQFLRRPLETLFLRDRHERGHVLRYKHSYALHIDISNFTIMTNSD